jgi:hypothetical protein
LVVTIGNSVIGQTFEAKLEEIEKPVQEPSCSDLVDSQQILVIANHLKGIEDPECICTA